MTIDRLGPVDPVAKFNKAKQSERTQKQQKTDSVSFSQEAKNLGEIYKATETVKNAADVRMDRVNEVKEKLKDPNYIDNKIVESVADSIMDLFGV